MALHFSQTTWWKQREPYQMPARAAPVSFPVWNARQPHLRTVFAILTSPFAKLAL